MSENIEVSTGLDYGYLRMQDVLICWGKKKFDRKNEHTFVNDFTFPKSFAEIPVVTIGVHSDGDEGETMAVSKWGATKIKLHCRVNNKHNLGETSTHAKITVSYIAMGKAG